MTDLEQLARDIYLRRIERKTGSTIEHLIGEAFDDAEKFFAEAGRRAKQGRKKSTSTTDTENG